MFSIIKAPFRKLKMDNLLMKQPCYTWLPVSRNHNVASCWLPCDITDISQWKFLSAFNLQLISISRQLPVNQITKKCEQSITSGPLYLPCSVQIHLVIRSIEQFQKRVTIPCCPMTYAVSFFKQTPGPNSFATLFSFFQVLCITKHLNRNKIMLNSYTSRSRESWEVTIHRYLIA